MAKRDLKAIEARRLEGARLLKQGLIEAEVARRLGVARQTVNKWALQLEQAKGAVGKLKAKPLGRPKRLSPQQLSALSQLLIRGALAAGFATELWTIKRIRVLIKREFGLAYSATGGWELVRSLGFTPQKPERRAMQQDPEAVKRWRTRSWPALKKTPPSKGVRSSS